MADTIRTVAQIEALLADNATGAISAQDVRDAFKTWRSTAAQTYVITPVETTISTVDTFVKAAGTFGISPATTGNFSIVANNQIINNAGVSRRVLVTASVTMTMASNNKIARVAFAKNGTVDSGTEQQRYVSTGADVGALSLQAVIDMANADYVEIWVANGTDNTNMTLEKANLIAMDLPL